MVALEPKEFRQKELVLAEQPHPWIVSPRRQWWPLLRRPYVRQREHGRLLRVRGVLVPLDLSCRAQRRNSQDGNSHVR